MFNDLANAHPDGEIGEDLHDAALVGKGRLLKDRQILHHTVMNDVLHDLVDKINLAAVQIRVVQVLGKGIVVYQGQY